MLLWTVGYGISSSLSVWLACEPPLESVPQKTAPLARCHSKSLGDCYRGCRALGIFNNYRITLADFAGFAEHCRALTRFQLKCCPYVGPGDI
ncbi:MAG: hypothetical protein JOS17DRAFT_757434 [Linnemannia elongata]|nr:MAG: hypothetical protein JOS17DRAFT_757434 [Linnemannia elongata]